MKQYKDGSYSDKAILVLDHGDAGVVDGDGDMIDERERGILLTLGEDMEEWQLGAGSAGLNHRISAATLEIKAASIKRVIMGLTRGPTHCMGRYSRKTSR